VQYPGGAAAPRATVFYYDYRDRLIGEMNGAALLDGDPVIDTSDNDTFLTEYVLDNLGDVTATNVYNIVPDTISGGGGIEEYAEPDDIGIVGTPELVAASTASYDDQGRML
jgi:hypothetical protein